MPSENISASSAVEAGHEVLLIDVSQPVPPGAALVLCALVKVHKEKEQIRLECFQPIKNTVAKQTPVSSLTLKIRGERQAIAPHNFNLSLVPSDSRPAVYRLINEYLYGAHD